MLFRSYAEERLVPADRLVIIPAGVSDEIAAAAMLKGMTVQYLLKRTFPVKAGTTILFHAAAGGVGLLLLQMAKRIGARTIGTVSTPAKAELARIGRYYATESMLLLDPVSGRYSAEDTPATGSDTLEAFFESVLSGRVPLPDLREHAVFGARRAQPPAA